MESPERHPFTASIDSQESPLFTFLNTLSPIKPIKSVHALHSFLELHCPPPPPVFVTPRIHAKSSRQRSSCKIIQGHSESGQNSIWIGSNNRDKSFTIQGESKSMNNCDQLSHNHSLNHVENQTAECMGVKSDTQSSALMSSVSKLKDVALNPERGSRAGKLQQCTPNCSLGDASTIILTDGLCKPLDSDTNDDKGRTLGCNVEAFQGSHLRESLSAIHLNCGRKISKKEVLEPIQNADVSLPSEVSNEVSPLNVNPEGWQSGALSSLTDLPFQYTTDSLVSVNTSTHEIAQNRYLDFMPTGTASEYGDDKNDARDGEIEAANKVNFPVQRGFRRRCLDFKVSDGQGISKRPSLLKSSVYSRSQIMPPCSSDQNLDQSLHLKTLRERTLAMSDAEAINSDSNPSEYQLLRELNCAPPELDCQPYASGTFSCSRNVLCGIGLHLNSLTGSVPLFQSSRGDSENAGYLTSVKVASDAVGATPPCSMQSGNRAGEVLSSPASTGFGISLQPRESFEEFQNGLQQETNIEEQMVVSFVDEIEMDLCKDHTLNAFESGAHASLLATRNSPLNDFEPYHDLRETFESYHGSKQTYSPLDHMLVSLPAVPRQIGIDSGVDSGQECSFLESEKKERKRASTADSYGNGCKRCNCKKSKCLKLYCECFAAGLFCVDNCFCQECHNKPDFEERVLEIRQQIEFRNPLAFAPKVVEAQAQSPLTGVLQGKTSDFTPARHKKGCSCKKSKCLKKYCECYQAGVGCSEGCRCEDCQNLYGKKEGFGKDAAEDNIDASDFCSNLSHASGLQHDDLSPITPFLQSAGQIDSLTMQRVTRKRCLTNEQLQSPESYLPKLKPSKAGKAAQSSFVGQKTGGRRLSSSLVSTKEKYKSAQLSPQWDRLGDFCTVTPLPQATHGKITSSASFSCGTDSSSSINAKQSNGISCSQSDSVTNTQLSSPRLCQQSVKTCILNGGAQPLKGLQGNPTTPCGNACLCGIEIDTPGKDLLFLPTSTAGLSEDDTFPDILREPEPVHRRPLLLSLKSNSPKQKRVSPPHFVGLRITSQQSPALRNGRKFTLQSISSATKSAV